MGVEDFSVSLELGSGDDFWIGWDSVLVNDFLFLRSLWALTISASGWNWIPVMISGSVVIQFSSMICDSDSVYGR